MHQIHHHQSPQLVSWSRYCLHQSMMIVHPHHALPIRSPGSSEALRCSPRRFHLIVDGRDPPLNNLHLHHRHPHECTQRAIKCGQPPPTTVFIIHNLWYFLHLNRRQRRTRCEPRLEEGSGSWRIFWPEGAKHRQNRSHQSSHWTIVVITVVIRLGRLLCPFPGATASVCISFPLLSPRGNLHCTLDNNLPIIIKFIDLPPLHSPPLYYYYSILWFIFNLPLFWHTDRKSIAAVLLHSHDPGQGWRRDSSAPLPINYFQPLRPRADSRTCPATIWSSSLMSVVSFGFLAAFRWRLIWLLTIDHISRYGNKNTLLSLSNPDKPSKRSPPLHAAPLQRITVITREMIK